MNKLLPCFLLLMFACNESSTSETQTEYIPPDIKVRQNNPEYVAKYAGTYEINILTHTDKSPEQFKLFNDRFAEWSWGSESKKYGRWAANKDTITVKIQGNTGDINETFIMQKGRFTEALSGQRYLKPNN